MEPLILFVRDDIAKENIKDNKHHKFLPYLTTVFFFIWINNLLGLIPIFPGGANLTGNITVTLFLALCTLFLTLFYSNKKLLDTHFCDSRCAYSFIANYDSYRNCWNLHQAICFNDSTFCEHYGWTHYYFSIDLYYFYK